MKKRRYVKLLSRMLEFGIERSDIIDLLGKSKGYVSERFRGLRNFDLADVYKICELLEIPAEEIYIFFPAEDMAA